MMTSSLPVLLTGIPRSGTTLVCRLLNSLPDVIALHEPMDVMSFRGKTPVEVFQMIDEFTGKNVKSIIENRTAVSKHVNGQVTDNEIPMTQGAELRKSVCELGEIRIGKELASPFLLAMKHNAAFAALLEHLVKRYRCFGIVKNPLSVLISWRTVDMPVHYGRTPVGEALDPGLKVRLDDTEHQLDRQIYLIDWFFSRFLESLPSGNILKYENIISTKGKCLKVIIPSASALDEDLDIRTRYSAVDPEIIKLTGERLIANGFHFKELYKEGEIYQAIDLALKMHQS